MALDLYSPCPCGSGKKFKWCCHDIHTDIDRAFEQEEQGQHDTALRILDDLTRRHPSNPETWGRKAQMLFMQSRIEEGEEVLQKAFDLNPNYPWGLLMRAQLRFREGEIQGGLILARRAAEAFHPDAHDLIAQAYSLIADAELGRNRPIATHAALRILVRLTPSDQQLREMLENVFGDKGRLPACARHFYELRRRPENMPPERKQAWDQALSQVDSPQLGPVVAAFEQLAQQDASDATAWYNLAVAQAWLGENRKALDALERSLEQEEDESRGTEAATLGEILRCGAGLEDLADYREHRVEYQMRDVRAVAALLQEWQQNGRLFPLPTQEPSVIVAVLLEPQTATVITTVSATSEDKKLAGYLLVAGDRMRIWSPREEAFHRLREEIKTRTALGVTEGAVQVGHIHFDDVVAEALLYPKSMGSESTDASRVVENAQKYFEESWIHHPLKSLAGNTPLDAAGHRALRKKLLGVIQFVKDCAALGAVASYDFDRLRRKLGLAASAPEQPREEGADISSMSTAELSSLAVDTLSDEQLEKAYQAAQKLDAAELSGHFAKALIARPVTAGTGHADRWPWYSFLVQRAIDQGDTDEALHFVNEGERVDGEANEGRRRNDYELRRGHVHVKRGEADTAHDVFSRLIERVPDNLKFRSSAAEGMLSMRQSQRALRFAEEGLTVARQKQDRDSEGYLMELVEAAKKQGGS